MKYYADTSNSRHINKLREKIGQVWSDFLNLFSMYADPNKRRYHLFDISCSFVPNSSFPFLFSVFVFVWELGASSSRGWWGICVCRLFPALSCAWPTLLKPMYFVFIICPSQNIPIILTDQLALLLFCYQKCNHNLKICIDISLLMA